MTIYGTEVLKDLLKRIHEGQVQVTGEDIGVFERLLQLNLVFHDGAGGAEGYFGVCPTSQGTSYLLADPVYPTAD